MNDRKLILVIKGVGNSVAKNNQSFDFDEIPKTTEHLMSSFSKRSQQFPALQPVFHSVLGL